MSEKPTLEERAEWLSEYFTDRRVGIGKERILEHLRAVQAETQEECARIAESFKRDPTHPSTEGAYVDATCNTIAAAIRKGNR